MNRHFFFHLVLVSANAVSCSQQETKTENEVEPAIENEAQQLDSTIIEYEIVNAVFDQPEIQYIIKEKEKINPNLSSTTASVTENPSTHGTAYYTVEIHDLANDEITWRTIGVYHVYYPEMRVAYFDTVQQKELTSLERQIQFKRNLDTNKTNANQH